MLTGLDDVNRETWATKIRVFLFSYGFGTVWMQQGVGDTDLFISILTQRMKDCALQTWNSDVHNNKKLDIYYVFYYVFIMYYVTTFKINNVKISMFRP